MPSFSPVDQQVLRECAKEGWKLQASRAVVDETTSFCSLCPKHYIRIGRVCRLESLLDQIDEVVWKYIKMPPPVIVFA